MVRSISTTCLLTVVFARKIITIDLLKLLINFIEKMVQTLSQRKKQSAITYEQFIKVHKSQLSLIPKLYWRTLYEKIQFKIFDLNKNLHVETKKITYSNQIEKQVTVRVCNKNGLKQNDPQSIFLIQHLIHYYASEGRELMKEFIVSRDPVLGYLKKLMNVNETDACSFINDVLDKSWKFVLPFQIKSKSNKKILPIWCLTEHVGMTIKHSFDPNFQMVTFQCVNLKRVFSVIFPIKPVINYGEEVTRDYTLFDQLSDDQIKLNAQMQQEHLNRKIARTNVMKGRTNLKVSIDERARNWSVEDERQLFQKTLLIPWQPDNLLDYFELDIRYQQSEPSTVEFFDRRLFDQPFSMMRLEPKDFKRKLLSENRDTLKVFCDDKHVVSYLTDPRYVLVNDTSLADIWWFSAYFFDFAKLPSSALINQFPLGHLLNEKDVLPVLCRRRLDNFDGNINPFTLFSFPTWLPTTFNLTTELVKFVSYFTAREQKQLDNFWIIKPTNQTKSADIFITNNIDAIIRLRSCFDRVACKYIANPLLFYRIDLKTLVKFELKYYVVLTSVLPLKLHVYKAFQVDCSNKPFDLKKTYNQEMHLTDMSCFNDQVERLDLDHIDFIQKFNYQFQSTRFDFDTIDTQVMAAIRELFELCTEKFPFSAINHNVASSAFYRVDVLLSWVEPMQFSTLPVKPNILEVNLNPNCNTICQKFPNFYNEIFNLMFLDEENCNFRAI